MLQDIVTVRLDLAKNVFQIHAIDEAGGVVARRQLRRTQVLKFFAALPQCVVGMEACASAHYWGRELMALGHEVRLMPPAYVKRGRPMRPTLKRSARRSLGRRCVSSQ